MQLRAMLPFFRPTDEVWRHWTYRSALYALIASIGLEILALLFYKSSLPPAVPLWFSRPWGEDQLAHPLWLVALPVGNLLIFMINTRMASTYLADHPMFGRILLLASFFISMLSLVTIINTLSLVI